ncbi:MAG: sodium-dependent transporter [Bacteroidales bacterium]|nr:sodium-dependent transporter [Bacteroidales bacterium]
MQNADNKREHFGSRITTIIAFAAAAIGLGNIWRFPYMVGENGGSAFILLYVIASALISLPILFSEIIIGRRAGVNAYDSMAKLRPGKKIWKWAGILPVFIPLFITSYYSVIGGWALDFLCRAGMLQFVRSGPELASGIFDSYISSTWTPIATHLVFLALAFGILLFGVKAGIERFCKICLPVLFFITIGIAIYSLTLPGAMDGVRYLLVPDFSRLDFQTATNALAQSFFSLSLGMGIGITFASYIPRNENITVTAGYTAISDLVYALIAGFAIIPAIFAAGITPEAGPGLIFKSLPYIFAKISLKAPITSVIVSVFFFVSVLLAALSSIIAMCEVGVDALIGKLGMKRRNACLLLFVICGAAGILCSLSFGPLSGVSIAGMSIFDFFDWSSSNILLFIMALLAIIFTGFAMKKEDLYDEFTNGGTLPFNRRIFPYYRFLIRWVCPLAILLLFVSNFIK